MTRNQKALMAAVAGISLGAAGAAASQAADKADDVKCYGINSCGHHSKCSVTQDDLDAVKALLGDQDYQAKFGKSEVHSCGSHAKCGASSSILNWAPSTAADCKAKGGYLVEEVGTPKKKVAKKA